MAAEANSVTLSTNFNVAPYYDDFDETKNFHRILFRPGLAVQARELTQMQSILQNQIDRFAEHIFKEGSTVKGMDMSYDVFYNYVKIRNNSYTTGNNVIVSSLLNKTLKGSVSGVRALVINTNDGSEANTPNFKTLFVKYIAANTSTGYKYFANNEILTDVTNAAITCNTITSALGGATGYGAAASFDAGVIYAKDHFIRVPAQTVVISKYSTSGSARVGYDVAESIITEVNDETLLDPASGSYNYAAPGAARLKLEVNLKVAGLTETVSNTFIELMQVKDGVVQSISTKPQYAQIRNYMAQRTFDESGDYSVYGLEPKIQESRKSGNNQGYSATGNSSQLFVSLSPGKAYVKGFDVDLIASRGTAIDKGIDYQSVESAKALADYGNYVIVDNFVGNWDVNQQAVVSLRDTQGNTVTISTFSSTNFPGVEIGKARVRAVEYYTGTPGLPSAQYKLYLTDVQMNTNKSFTAVQSLGYNGGTGTVYGKADIINSNGLNANTLDSVFERSLFRLPASSIRKLRNTSGAVNNDFEFYKAYDVTFDTAGVATLNTSDATETFDGSSTLSPGATRTDFIVISRGTSSGGSSNTTYLTGTVTITSGANTVTGSGTSFNTQFNPGDVIHVSNNADYVVSEVASATSLKLTKNVTATKTAVKYFKRFKPGQILDFGGVGVGGNRSIAISPATTATLSLNEGTLGAALNATVIAHVNKIDGQEATKTVARNRLVQIRINAGGGTSYTANTTGPWPLGLSDGFKLVSVRKKSGSNFTTVTDGNDVTSNFTLDSGMKDNYYSHARLVKTTGLTIGSTDRLLVTLDHFTHANRERGYFSVDSYPVDDLNAGTDTTKIYTYEIPVFVSPISGSAYDLRDCVDFRPRMSDTANSVTSLTDISINPKTSNTFSTASGGLHFPTVGSDFTTDLDYYLRRIDILSLTQDGRIVASRGLPAIKPVPPNVPADVMTVGTMYIPPYPSIPPVLARRYGRPDYEVKMRKISNRRYTMKDIGKISERVDRLEYYTSLSLLEKTAKDLSVLDNAGLDRFKNGMLVDSFTSHAIGNVFDPDYKIAVDQGRGEMRPRFTLDETPLVYTANSTYVVRTNVTPAGVSKDQRITFTTTPATAAFQAGATITSGGYTATIRNKVGNRIYVENATGNFAVGAGVTSSDGGATSLTISAVSVNDPGVLVTLPYSHDILVKQPYATTTRNCVGTFYRHVGTLELNPNTDYWSETRYAPTPTVIDIDLNTDAWAYQASSWPAHYDAPITTNVGSPINNGTTTENVGGEYTVWNPDGSGTVMQNTRDMTHYSQPTKTVTNGLQPGVKINTNTFEAGNVTRSTQLITQMRSRNILFKAYGMKASSRIYGFFDAVDVNAYITPLTQAEYDSGLKTTTGAPIIPASSEGSALYTDVNGFSYGQFRLPNDAARSFTTGTKRFRLVDNPTNSAVFGQYTTSCEAQYSAEGLINNVQALTITTRSVEITQTKLSPTTTGATPYDVQSGTGSKVVGLIPAPPPPPSSDSGPVAAGSDSDPIAQTLFITSKLTTRVTTSGMYLTKLDLFFATKDSTLPVTVELREVDQLTGAITPRVVPFSRVILNPADVNVSELGTDATPVYFPSPIYLPDESEYAIVIVPAAVNPNYNVHTAELGVQDRSGSGESVTSQPGSGFLFTSANQRVWVPVEKEDLKFTAYYAKFDKTNFGNVIVKNPPREHLTIANTTGPLDRIGDTVVGETRIVGSFSIATGSPSNTAAITTHIANNSAYAQGITSGATGKIVAYSSNSLRLRDVSTNVKFRGGEKIRIRIANTTTRNANTGEIKGSGTTTSATYPIGRITLNDSINYANTRLILANVAYINSGPVFANATYFKVDTYIKSQTNGYSGRIVTIVNPTIDNFNLITNMIIPSNNEVKAYAKMAKSMSARDSSFFRVNINSDNMLATPRYMLSYSTESNTAASSATMKSDRSIEIKYVYEGRNSVASPAIDLERITLYTTHNLINDETTVSSSETNVKSGGLSEARYITRIVTLADGMDAEDLRVYLTAYKPSGSNFLVYYKIMNADDADGIGEKKWIPMTLNTSQGFSSATRYSSSENVDDFLELVYDVPTWSDTYKAGANTTNGIVQYVSNSKARYFGYKYFTIKIVPVNTTSANPPRVKDLRVIATMSKV